MVVGQLQAPTVMLGCSSRIPSFHDRLLSSSLFGDGVRAGHSKGNIYGVRLGKLSIPTERCATTTKRFSPTSAVLANVAKDFMVTSSLPVSVF